MAKANRSTIPSTTTSDSVSKTPVTPVSIPTAPAAAPAKVGKKIDPAIQANALKTFAAYSVKFTPETSKWIVWGKSGQCRLLDKQDIACCLLAKLDSFPKGENGGLDLKAMMGLRKAFRKLLDNVKTEWLDKAQAVFSPCRKEYHDVIHGRVAAAVKDKQLKMERYQFNVTKAGIVHVASRLTHRPTA